MGKLCRFNYFTRLFYDQHLTIAYNLFYFILMLSLYFNVFEEDHGEKTRIKGKDSNGRKQSSTGAQTVLGVILAFVFALILGIVYSIHNKLELTFGDSLLTRYMIPTMAFVTATFVLKKLVVVVFFPTKKTKK